MEIFLLFVIILLLVVFHIVKNSKISLVEKKLSHIEKYLESINFQQTEKSNNQSVQENNVKVNVEETIIATKPIIIEEPIIIEPKFTEDVTIASLLNDFDKAPEKELTTNSLMNDSNQDDESIPAPIVQPATPIVVVESWYQRFRKNNPDIEKFIGENILSKVAIAILVIGIAFFVKYAIDKEWINEIARVGIGILCGAIVLGFAHRLHKNFQAFSSVLVAGGISIFYFTIGIAFHQYHLFGQTTAFIIMLFITAFSVFISILYNRVELAALSIVGGFATPFMISTGEGNYVVLFTYVLILDCGMLVLAYLRKWNLINILTYCFTMLLYFIWLQTKVIAMPNAPYKGAFIFAAIFYVVFVLMNIINNIKEKRKFDSLELSILISNTFLFYGIGMQILSYYHPELRGVFSIIMALFNLVCAWLLYKKFKADDKLVYLMIGLTLTFITLIAPVQLNGNYITIFWAAEAVLLIWLAQKSGIILYKFASVIITFLMIISLVMDWGNIYTNYYDVPLAIILNKAFITGFVSSFALLSIVLLLKKETESVNYLTITFNPKKYSKFLSVTFLVLLYFTGFLELAYQINDRIYNPFTNFVILGAYHLLFFVLLNVTVSKLKGFTANKAIFILNFINVILFVVVLAQFPLIEFKDNFLEGYNIQVGFIFHYVSIACATITVLQMHKAISNPDFNLNTNKVLNTILVSLSILYVSSTELLLHILKVTLPASFNEVVDYSDRYLQYDNTVTHIVKIGFPILWGILAFVFLFIGMKKQNKTFRVIALLLIALILIKLFTYDINEASEAGKIVAFIILGVVLLIISFMYQKIKALLLDDDEIKKDDITNEKIT